MPIRQIGTAVIVGFEGKVLPGTIVENEEDGPVADVEAIPNEEADDETELVSNEGVEGTVECIDVAGSFDDAKIRDAIEIDGEAYGIASLRRRRSRKAKKLSIGFVKRGAMVYT